MKQFMVIFMKKDLQLREHRIVYADTHNEAVKAIRNHYGRGVVTIISVRIIMED